MTNELVLDLAVVAVVILFTIIGFVRGVQREIFATAAILGCWALASAWTPRWSARLADVAQLSERTSAFIITVGLLAGGLVILGWGAGGAIGAPPASPGQRLSGAIVGGINAVLLVSYGLSTYTRYLSTLKGREIIDAARVAPIVRDDYRYALAIALAVAVVLTVIALAIGGSGGKAPLPVGRPYPAPSRRDQAAAGADDYKVEPTKRQASKDLNNTMPIVPVEPARFSDTGGRRQQTRFQTTQNREWASVQNNQATAPISFGANGPEEGAATVSCVNCGATVTLSDVYCPHCGKLTR